jgi:hypothetical protein
MGQILSPQPSQLAGTTIGSNWGSNGGSLGSGDVGQNLLPVSMKIAAQTIGLDLVAVKPSPGPKIDLIYIDFQYDDMNTSQGVPQVFKYTDTKLATYSTALRAYLATQGMVETVGGFKLDGKRVFININTGAVVNTEPVGKQNIVEFLGFSRIDGQLILRAYRQANAVGNLSVSSPYAAPHTFDQTQNTFAPTTPMTDQFLNMPSSTTVFTASGATATSATASRLIDMVSALEDHIPAFSTNFSSNSKGGTFPMSRDEDDNTYAGVIGPKISSKSISIGSIEVSSALKRTDIEDIKANTGMDIVQKMESILVNELSQTISKQIVSRIFVMGDLNRESAPLFGGTQTIDAGVGIQTIFDLDTNYVGAGGPGGETTHAIQRKLITKLAHASNFLATEGRVGPAQYAVTNGGLAAALMDIAGYTINPSKSKQNGAGQLYPVGQIGDIQIYVDPYMRYNDNRIVIGRKNNPDQPGIIFVPYLMAQSVSLISEANFAPRMLLRSRCAVAEVGFFPQKQYMTIKVKDTNSFLN